MKEEEVNSYIGDFSENAKIVLEKRYLRKDDKGQVVETIEDLFQRVADNIARVDEQYGKKKNDIDKTRETFFQMMISRDFLPNSPTLMNAGNDLQQLSACFVLPVEDSIEGIFDAVKNTALIHKSGGGTGFSFSRLRPKNDTVKSTKGVSSGPVSFMSVFDSATEAVKQGGTRRGANMGILRVDHPDIMEFIRSKELSGRKLTNFNISVAITEDFMNAVIEKRDYDIIHPLSGEKATKRNAEEVFNLILKKAWETGDPGIIFIDRINRDNPTPRLGEIESTNPCGEQPLLPFEACNLGSINLKNTLKLDQAGKYVIDWKKLEKTIISATRFLDNVVDASLFPLEKISQMVKKNRKIGLGIMGFAEMLILMEIAYDSEKALETAEKLMAFIDEKSKAASRELAKTRGAFPAFKGSVYDSNNELPLRNATTTTIAPTGTISIIANCSSGIEPLFAVCFTRNVLDGKKLTDINPVFEEIARRYGFYSEELIEKISEEGSVQKIDEVPDKWKRIFKTAHDISPEWHIKMQSAFQKHTDNAVSKTVNFHHDATVDDFKEVYLQAFKLDCKGVTAFRDGCLDTQVLNVGHSSKKKETNDKIEFPPVAPRERQDVMKGVTRRVKTGCGYLYVTLNYDDKGVFEIFNQIGKAGGCAASQSEAIGRLASLSLRCGIKPDYIIEQLKGISCHRPSWDNGRKIMSCADAIAKAIEGFHLHKAEDISEGELKYEMAKHAKTKQEIMLIGACPDCGSPLEINEGCLTCRHCGYSECG